MGYVEELLKDLIGSDEPDAAELKKGQRLARELQKLEIARSMEAQVVKARREIEDTIVDILGPWVKLVREKGHKTLADIIDGVLPKEGLNTLEVPKRILKAFPRFVLSVQAIKDFLRGHFATASTKEVSEAMSIRRGYLAKLVSPRFVGDLETQTKKIEDHFRGDEGLKALFTERREAAKLLKSLLKEEAVSINQNSYFDEEFYAALEEKSGYRMARGLAEMEKSSKQVRAR